MKSRFLAARLANGTGHYCEDGNGQSGKGVGGCRSIGQDGHVVSLGTAVHTSNVLFATRSAWRLVSAYSVA
eukprot:2081218-Pleurochrysis_carterae.AAC.3